MKTAIWSVQVQGSILSFAYSGLRQRDEVQKAAEKYYRTDNVIVLRRVRFLK